MKQNRWIPALVVSLSFANVGCRPQMATATKRSPLQAEAGGYVNTIGIQFVSITYERSRSKSHPVATSELSTRQRSDGEFLIAAHEVTVGQFRLFVERTEYVTEAERDEQGGWGFDAQTGRVGQKRGRCWRNPGFEQNEDHPVVQVSWNDAEAFCGWLSRKEQRTYRLPTEREWERACSAGSDSAYSFGADPEKLDEVANFADSSLLRRFQFATWADRDGDGFPFTAPVGSFRPNGYGLYDAHGNVWEWCADWYRSPSARMANAEGNVSSEKGFRVIRGGGWYDPAERCRSRSTIYFDPTFRYCQLSGFRVLLEVDAAAGAKNESEG